MLICIKTHRTYSFERGEGPGPLSPPLDPHLSIRYSLHVPTMKIHISQGIGIALSLIVVYLRKCWTVDYP